IFILACDNRSANGAWRAGGTPADAPAGEEGGLLMPAIAIKRIYEPPAGDDGFRVLVDRVWPRGMTKAEARIDLWAKELAPSTALRKWFGHDPARWAEFRRRYREELDGQGEALHG